MRLLLLLAMLMLCLLPRRQRLPLGAHKLLLLLLLTLQQERLFLLPISLTFLRRGVLLVKKLLQSSRPLLWNSVLRLLGPLLLLLLHRELESHVTRMLVESLPRLRLGEEAQRVQGSHQTRLGGTICCIARHEDGTKMQPDLTSNARIE